MARRNPWLFVLFVDLMLTSALPKSTYNDSVRLYRDMTQNNDPRVRPILDQSEAITVYAKMHINSLFEIDEVQQVIQMNAWVNFTWYDELRSWNPEDYGNVSVIHPNILDMWRPRVLVNSSVSVLDVFKDGNINAGLFSNGLTYWYPAAVFHNYCEMDFTYFPFDKHECKVIFISTDLESEIEFIQATSHEYQDVKSNGEWEFTELTTGSLNFSYSPTVGSFFVQIHFKRRPKFFIYQVLIPMIVLSAISSLVFILPASSGERASYATTMLLAMTVLMGSVTEHLSRTSDRFPIIIYYLSGLVTLNTFSVIASVLQTRILSFLANKLERICKKKKHVNVDDQQDLYTEESCSTQVKLKFVCNDSLYINSSTNQHADEVCFDSQRSTDHSSSSACQKSESHRERFSKVNTGTELKPSSSYTNARRFPKLLCEGFGKRLTCFLKDADFLLFSLYIFITCVVNIYFLSKLTEQGH